MNPEFLWGNERLKWNDTECVFIASTNPLKNLYQLWCFPFQVSIAFKLLIKYRKKGKIITFSFFNNWTNF